MHKCGSFCEHFILFQKRQIRNCQKFKKTATTHANSRINNCEKVSKEDSCGKSHQNLKSWCHEDLPAVLLLEHF